MKEIYTVAVISCITNHNEIQTDHAARYVNHSAFCRGIRHHSASRPTASVSFSHPDSGGGNTEKVPDYRVQACHRRLR